MIDPLLVETALRIHTAHEGAARARPEQTCWSEPLWRALEDAGLTGVGIPESAGGVGGTAADAAELVRISGYCAAPVPLAETLLVGGPALVEAGLVVPPGRLAAAPVPGELTAETAGAGWCVSGTAHEVAWAAVADHVVAVADGATQGPVLVLLPAGSVRIVAGTNLAQESRDTVTADGVLVVGAPLGPGAGAGWRRRGATARALQIAGALERVLEMTVRHAKDRVQFGRPIASFQAVGHLIAQLGEAVAGARMAAETAATAPDGEEPAIAKIIAGEAASHGASIAHQVFGAMGTTRECGLHLYTRRLWSWRDEFGSEREWAATLGAGLRDRGGADIWELITR